MFRVRGTRPDAITVAAGRLTVKIHVADRRTVDIAWSIWVAFTGSCAEYADVRAHVKFFHFRNALETVDQVAGTPSKTPFGSIGREVYEIGIGVDYIGNCATEVDHAVAK